MSNFGNPTSNKIDIYSTTDCVLDKIRFFTTSDLSACTESELEYIDVWLPADTETTPTETTTPPYYS